MAHVVTAPCFGCRYTDCAVVCPVESFCEGEQMLFIDPDVCIDCTECVGECPTEAIYQEQDVPEKWNDFIELNREMAPQYPMICTKKEPLAG